MSEDILLDIENWKIEANAVISDIKDHVQSIAISNELPNNDQSIYLNLTTKEGANYCIQLSGIGFRIIGDKHNTMNINDKEWFETPYSLLNQISPLFCDSFGNSLIKKLNELNKN